MPQTMRDKIYSELKREQKIHPQINPLYCYKELADIIQFNATEIRRAKSVLAADAKPQLLFKSHATPQATSTRVLRMETRTDDGSLPILCRVDLSQIPSATSRNIFGQQPRPINMKNGVFITEDAMYQKNEYEHSIVVLARPYPQLSKPQRASNRASPIAKPAHKQTQQL